MKDPNETDYDNAPISQAEWNEIEDEVYQESADWSHYDDKTGVTL